MIPGYMPFEALEMFHKNAMHRARYMIRNLEPIKPAKIAVRTSKNGHLLLNTPPKTISKIVPMSAFATFGSANFDLDTFNYA